MCFLDWGPAEGKGHGLFLSLLRLEIAANFDIWQRHPRLLIAILSFSPLLPQRPDKQLQILILSVSTFIISFYRSVPWPSASALPHLPSFFLSWVLSRLLACVSDVFMIPGCEFPSVQTCVNGKLLFTCIWELFLGDIQKERKKLQSSVHWVGRPFCSLSSLIFG